MTNIGNPLEPTRSPKRPLNGEQLERAHVPQQALGEDWAVTKAEKVGRDVVKLEDPRDLGALVTSLPPNKRVKLGGDKTDEELNKSHIRKKVKGVALVKEEYLIEHPKTRKSENDAAAESERPVDDRDRTENGAKKKKKKKNQGQNTARQYVFSKDAISLCPSRANSAELSPKECRHGDRCSFCHDLRKYLREGKGTHLATFSGRCPVWEAIGKCYAGWKCRFLSSHMEEIDRKDGRKELLLTVDLTRVATADIDDDEIRAGIVNVITTQDKYDLSRRKTKTEKADKYTQWLERDTKELFKMHHKRKTSEEHVQDNEVHVDVDEDDTKENRADLEDNRARYTEPPFWPSEKRKVYFGPETPILAPLTTQGNLPFRRLCVELGAQLTYSEMAMTLPLMQGQRSEWALMKAHQSEMLPPRFLPKTASVVQGYENSRDFKFGAQISAHKPSVAIKTTEILTNLLPRLRVIDLNCGCPIELVYRVGAGSALLESPSKLEKIIRGMNALSGEVPITAKIRMGTKDGKPTAYKLVERLALGGDDVQDRLGPPGCAAITLHGRSRQQRYTRSADWGYIADCAALIKSLHGKKDALADTANNPDPRQLPNGERMYFIGNGDCYSHVDYFDHINNSGVDAVMLARGALIKPWLFEEIEKGQYLDKSASERLTYVEKFARYGLEAWGSDNVGVGQTRRFLLEWLSFAHRYIPVGILEHLPPSLQDRPPAYKGRNDMETLLASDNYKDWIKISEMFLGPAGADFLFQPKHKSNSYEIEAEG